MGGYLLLFLVVFIALAAFFQADFMLVVVYLLGGAAMVNWWWSRRSARNVKVDRDLPERAFFNETIQVCLTARNTSRIPVLWMHIRDNLPSELAVAGQVQEVVSLGTKGARSLVYLLDCRQRGYYPIGPASVTIGDFLGLTSPQILKSKEDHLTVFPKIIPLTRIVVPSHSPLGTLHTNQPLFEDPACVRGKRDYLPGDSQRRIDWKASSVAHRLLVKQFEPSIALESMIFLNLNRQEYQLKDLYRASELAIIAAASIANWVVRARQAVGLASNGIDPLAEDGKPPMIAPGRGRGRLVRILEVLARLRSSETFPFVNLIQREMVGLSWGSTIMVIANQVDDNLFEALFQARRRGLSPILLVCGYVDRIVEIERKAAYFHTPFVHILSEQDFDIWRN